MGLLFGVGGAVAFCYVRRKRRRLQLINRKYTPYGESDDFAGVEATNSAGPDTPDIIS